MYQAPTPLFMQALAVCSLVHWQSRNIFITEHWYSQLLRLLLPRARMHSRGKAMPSCLCVSAKNLEKCFKQGRKGVYRRHSQWKTISIIILGRICTWYKSRLFFMPFFQLLHIIGFVAPPLSKWLFHIGCSYRHKMCKHKLQKCGDGIWQWRWWKLKIP